LRAFAALPPSARRTILHARRRYAPWEEGFDLTPPRLHEGEETGPPDFVGIGAQKAGTTWWHDLIAAHPRVASRPDIHKERHFFDRYATTAFGSADGARYHGWFPRMPGLLAGEWTPDYLQFAWAPALLAEAAPATRLLVILRDPVDRLRSGLSHHRRHVGPLTMQACADAVNRGFYDQALARWLEHFPPEQLLLLQYERCAADPRGELARTYEFLGLAPFVPAAIERRVSGSTDLVELDPDARRRLVDAYTPDVVALARNHPEMALDLARWPNFSDLVSQ